MMMIGEDGDKKMREETNRMKAQIASIKHQIDVLGKHRKKKKTKR